MIILTNRLKAMADNINKGERVADIGTDHGYLPLYLKENNISPKVVLVDVSKGSLIKAEENAKRLFPNETMDLRLGDGLEPIDFSEVDTIVMAGIGGNLIVNIMEWNLEKTLSFKKFILQPRNNGGALRRFLFEHGFTIEKLEIVPEDKRYCEIMTVLSPGTNEYKGKIDSRGIPQIEFDYPDELGASIGEKSFNKDYIQFIKNLEETILSNIISGRISNGETIDDNDQSLKKHKERIERLDYLLSLGTRA